MANSPKIAVVDDNTDYLFTLETFLKKNGFPVITADNGKDGLELIRREKPDVVLLDVMMETLFSGFELCKTLRTDVELKHIAIIGISGMGDELGIDYNQWPDYDYFSPEMFLEKPVDKQRLLQFIPEAIQKAAERQKRPEWEKEREAKWAKMKSGS